MNLMHHTAILWRGPGSVQIGGDRARHVRLDDLHASDQLWLASQARPAHASDVPEASPDLLAALAEADLMDHPDRDVYKRQFPRCAGSDPGHPSGTGARNHRRRRR